MNINKTIKKLDLQEYIENFKSYFSRDKSIDMMGDINVHFKLINEISKYDFKNLPKLINLDNQISRLYKKDYLYLDDIFSFIKIINYFIYLQQFDLNGKFESWIKSIVIPLEILNICNIFNDKGIIRDGFHEQLDIVRNNIFIVKEKISQSLKNITNNKNIQPYLVDHQLHFVNGEQTILVRGGFTKVIQAKILDRSMSGFFFILPSTIDNLKQELSKLESLRDELFKKIAKEYSAIFEKNLLFIKYINREFDRLDHYISRISFAKEDDKNFIIPSASSLKQKLVNFKHPAIKKAKPINIDFTKNIIIITGVNAGGKTMLLKSILSATFLTKYLIPFYCHKSTSISNFKNIVTILDDPQNIKNDISTFAGRMLEFSKIFEQKDIIIGVDEIELGTDSDEAASLFKVIVEKLESNNVKIIITTHHKRLAALLALNPQTQLIAAIYDEENRKPTYNFLEGIIGKSYAFETAKRYGIPHNIVKMSQEIYSKDNEKLNDLIQKGIELEIDLKNKILNYDSLIDKQTKINLKLEQQKENADLIINEQKHLLKTQYNQAIKEAQKIIKGTNRNDAHRILNNANKQVSKIKVEKLQNAKIFEIGQEVSYGNTIGTIISIKGKKINLEIKNGIKIKVSKEDIKLRDIKEKLKNKNIKKIINVNIQKPKGGFIKLNLNGYRSDEAIGILDKFISDSLINGFDEILVYHGVGTGKLSYAIKEFLKKHPKILGYENAPINLGGLGAKIIML